MYLCMECPTVYINNNLSKVLCNVIKQLLILQENVYQCTPQVRLIETVKGTS